MYHSGRCAVAHAYDKNQRVNPDNPIESIRLSQDLPIIKALAEYFIEYELGLKSRKTIWKEHLYELNGFRDSLGISIVSDLKEKKKVDIRTIPKFPKLGIGLREHEKFQAFRYLNSEIIESIDGCLVVNCRSDNNLVDVVLILNLPDEHLVLDPLKNIGLKDDGSVEAIRNFIDRIQFVKGLFLNGKLEVWDDDKGKLLGRCNAFLPVNIDVSATIDNWDQMLEKLNLELKNISGVS